MTLDEKNILNVFLRKRPIELFLEIKREGYTKQPDIYKRKNITYAHVVILLHKFEQGKLIIRKKTGRLYQIRLTDKGKEFQDFLFKLKELLEVK